MKEKQPNILVIFPDQLRRNALGCYGDPNVSTPHIDALAGGGVQFSNACSTFPICVPFRFTLMTGQYAHSRFAPSIEFRMSPAERTLADEFGDAGYETIYCGKWHLSGGFGHLPNHTARKANLTPVPREHRERWDKWMGFEICNSPFETLYFEDNDPDPKRLNGYQTDGLFNLTMNYLQERKDQDNPFFCICSVEPPHFPLEVPDEYLSKWKKRKIELPPNFYYEDQRPTPGKKISDTIHDRKQAVEDLKTYYAMIENLDWNVGRMMRFLQDSGLQENTIVVFMSDHGQMDASHSENSLVKEHPFEESIGVPLLVNDLRKGSKKSGKVSDVTCSEDLYPTLLGLAGLRPQQTLPDQDLSGLVRQEQNKLNREGVMLQYTHDLFTNGSYHEKYWRGFRTQRYKYTVLGNAEEGGKPWQFFDLQKDPYELNNLVEKESMQDHIKHLHRLLRDRLIETDDSYVLAPAFGEKGLNLWNYVTTHMVC